MTTEHTYLIIAGATRCGTTSLFLYLADHPQVCRSPVKEVRFFLDPDYPLPAHCPYESGLSSYVSLFRGCTDYRRVRLEASPDYLYSSGTAQRLAASRLNVKLVFILREPIQRLFSWRRFAIMRGLIETDTTMDEFVEMQARGAEVECAPYYFRVLHQGRYSEYLSRFFDILPPEDILVLWFEELALGPRKAATATAEFAGISPDFFTTYEFNIHNNSRKIRNQNLSVAYYRTKHELRRLSENAPRIRVALKNIGAWFDRFYARLNARNDGENDSAVSLPTAQFLRDYYTNECERVAALVSRRPPWRIPDLEMRRE